jgi:gamma-glutamylcyclotransferase (GGCT)/AIG2-like uncharacterized protein YtfP
MIFNMVTKAKYPLFVYGSLKKDHGAHRIIAGADFISEAKVQGSLVDLGYFPGLLLDTEKYGVSGELYSITEKHLKSTDMLESEGSFYFRTVVDAKLPDGQIIDTYVYFLPTWYCKRYPKIEGGNWHGGVYSPVQMVQSERSGVKQGDKDTQNQLIETNVQGEA